MIPVEPAAPLGLSGPPLRVHVIGVGGAGMSAIAIVLSSMGHVVSGSDQRPSPMLDRLASVGITTTVGSDPGAVAGADVVTFSTAVPATDPELAAARRQGITTLARSAMLSAICACRPTLAVAGTHGKTTTSSMLALVLSGAGFDPSFIIGGDVTQLGTGAKWSDGDWFVAEADESDGTFLELERSAAIVTNIEPDHLEFYGGFDGLRDAFDRFMVETAGPVVVCIDDPLAAEAVARIGARCARLVTYGTAEGADFRMTEVTPGARDVSWTVSGPGADRAAGGPFPLVLAVPGLHNARNAMAAAALALELGAAVGPVGDALAGYRGVGRRYEFRGEAGGVTFVDDYAHLPTEVSAAIAAATAGGWNRVIGVFQPHRFSRTEALWETFGGAFAGLDELVVCDIYPSGEAPRPGVTGHLIVDAVRAARPEDTVVWCPTRAELMTHLTGHLTPGDLCLTLGAGDLTTLPDELIEVLGRPDVDAALAARFGDRLERDRSLAPMCTYRVGGAARWFLTADSVEDLTAIASVAGSHRLPTLVVGRGSNLLVADGGFEGLAIALSGVFDTISVDAGRRLPGEVVEVTAGAAVSLPVLARRCVTEGLGGLEWAVGVPGSVGGAVRMNAGGHGSDMAASLLGVRVIDLRTGDDVAVPAADLDLAYRHSSIRTDQVVVSATFGLTVDPSASDAALGEIVAWRRANQPGGPNAGSVFTNPAGDSAGRLIDAAGCKGLRVGSAEVSPKHANFIQADPGGRADDVVALMAEVRRRVRAHSGVELRAETRLVGFDDDVTAAAGARAGDRR